MLLSSNVQKIDCPNLHVPLSLKPYVFYRVFFIHFLLKYCYNSTDQKKTEKERPEKNI